MKNLKYILLISLFPMLGNAQNIDKSTNINGLKLSGTLEMFKSDLFLITGDEPAYQEAPTLQQALKRKIRLGIRDAEYQGNKYRQFGNFTAAHITMQFYEGKLFKVQWTFRDKTNLTNIYNYLVDTYADTFGASKEEVFDDFRQVEWQGRLKYLQVFMDKESDVTLVYEDAKVAKKAQKVIAKAN